jgi:hypothetical protein
VHGVGSEAILEKFEIGFVSTGECVYVSMCVSEYFIFDIDLIFDEYLLICLHALFLSYTKTNQNGNGLRNFVYSSTEMHAFCFTASSPCVRKHNRKNMVIAFGNKNPNVSSTVFSTLCKHVHPTTEITARYFIIILLL